MKSGDPWPDLDEAEHRVLMMQRKLHRWAVAEPGHRFDDLANLVYVGCPMIPGHGYWVSQAASLGLLWRSRIS